MDFRLKQLVAWIKKTAAPANGLLVPVSGGSDSALCFWLCQQAFPDKTEGVFVGDKLPCLDWFEKIGTIIKIPSLEGSDDIEVARWAKFQTRCKQEKRWLVGSRSRTEEVLGSYSQASRCAIYLPLIRVWKAEIMELCVAAGVPAEIIDSSRLADLDCGRPQELADIPLELIDVFLLVKEKELPVEKLVALTKAQIDYLEDLFVQNQYKRCLPIRGPALDLSVI